MNHRSAPMGLQSGLLVVHAPVGQRDQFGGLSPRVADRDADRQAHQLRASTDLDEHGVVGGDAARPAVGVRDLHDAPETVHETLMCLLKTHEDKSRVTREVSERLLGKVA